MADEATTNTQIEVFLDEVRSKLSGTYNYEPADSTEKWVYAEVSVDNSASTDLLDTSDSYFGSADQVATGDKILWIAIKNTAAVATSGIGVSFDAGDAAYDTDDTIIIGAGDMLVAKVPNTTVAKTHARSCTLSGLKPSAQGSLTITVLVAAILDDV
tara:strand:+ start:2134 stop:2604 length:471 start_codon:yes stop_codon:yes gene_type:complete